MNGVRLGASALIFAALLGGSWVAIFHREWVAPPPEEEEHEEVATVVPVRVTKVATLAFHRWVEGWGTVAAEPASANLPAGSARVASPSAGVLAEARCAEGQKVEKGATLFQLDTRLASAEAQKVAAQRLAARATVDRLGVSAEFSQRELERNRKLFADQLVSERELRAAEQASASAQKELAEATARVGEAETIVMASRTQAALLRVQSPLSGTVVKVNVNPGEAVEASTVLAEIIDLDRLVVAATIPASELHSLAIGQRVELSVSRAGDGGDADGGAPVLGEVGFVGLAVDTKTDSVPIRITFPKDSGLRPGEYLHVRVMVEERAARLAVPNDSVVEREDGAQVAIVKGDHATFVPVTLGLREGTMVEVAGAGLAPGTVVVGAGAYGLPKETKIRVLGP